MKMKTYFIDLRGHEMTSKWQKWKAETKISKIQR